MGELLILSDIVAGLDLRQEYTLLGVRDWLKIDREKFHLLCHRLPGKPRNIPSLQRYVLVHILKDSEENNEERIRREYMHSRQCTIFAVQNCEIVSNGKHDIGLRFYDINRLDGKIRVFERDRHIICAPSDLGVTRDFYDALYGIRTEINDACGLKQTTAKLLNRA